MQITKSGPVFQQGRFPYVVPASLAGQPYSAHKTARIADLGKAEITAPVVGKTTHTEYSSLRMPGSEFFITI